MNHGVEGAPSFIIARVWSIDAFKVLGRVIENLPDFDRAEHRIAVPGHQNVCAELRHRTQRLGPFARVALRLLRIARIGRRPDDQVAGEENFLRGEVDPTMIVGLTARVMAFKLMLARGNVQLMIEVGVGIDILGRAIPSGRLNCRVLATLL